MRSSYIDLMPAFLLLLAIAIIVFAAANGAKELAYGVGGFFLFIGLCSLLVRWIRMKTSEFAVTTKRVIIKVGFIRRRTMELLLGQVEAIGVDQGILGRIIGYGTISVAAQATRRSPYGQSQSPLSLNGRCKCRAHLDSSLTWRRWAPSCRPIEIRRAVVKRSTVSRKKGRPDHPGAAVLHAHRLGAPTDYNDASLSAVVQGGAGGPIGVMA